MALSAPIAAAAQRALFQRKLTQLTTDQMAALLAALAPPQLAALIQLIQADDFDRIGKAVSFYVRGALRAQAATDAAALAASPSISQADVEALLT